jgi:GTP-binding protein Era
MRPKPVLAIVGRPNVGKSTLFNRLIGQRVAIVEDTPGVTRDRLYGEGEWLGQLFVVIDTGGILFGEDDPLIEQVRVQAQVAMHEADCVLFLVDARDGLTPADAEVADLLRRGGKPTLLLVNKADNPQQWESQRAEFFALGLGEPIPISSIHGHNIAEVLERAFEHLQAQPAPESDEEPADEPIKIAIVGRPNVGKSSLLNALLGEERAITTEIPGTTRDTLEESLIIGGAPIVILDTAGLRESADVVEQIGIERARRAAERADLILFVYDLTAPDWNADRALLESLPPHTPKLLVGNKVDAAPKRQQHARSVFPNSVFISALTGTGLDALQEAILTALEVQRVGEETPTLTHQRHIQAVADAKRTLEQTREALRQGYPPDLIAVDLRAAWLALGAITGETADETLVQRIFRDFCIGK